MRQVLHGEEQQILVGQRLHRVHDVRRRVDERARRREGLGLALDEDPSLTLEHVGPLLVRVRVRVRDGAARDGDQADLHALALDDRARRRRVALAHLYDRELRELEDEPPFARLGRTLVPSRAHGSSGWSPPMSGLSRHSQVNRTSATKSSIAWQTISGQSLPYLT